MKLGQKLKEARTQAGHSQDAVAKRIGVSRQSVSNWENDRTYPDIGSLLKLSDLYGLSLDEMLKEDDTIPAHFENLAARRKRFCQIMMEVGTMLEIFSLMILGQDFLVMGYLTTGLGAVLVYLAFMGHLRYFDHTRKEIRQGFTGLAILVCVNLLRVVFPVQDSSDLSSILYSAINFGGVCLLWQSGVYGMFWKSPRVLVYLAFIIAMPIFTLTMNLRSAGAFVSNHPFQHDYRVAQVLYSHDGDTAENVRVHLSNTLSVDYRLNITQPDGTYEKLGSCIYTEPLPGQTEQALWQLIPEADPDTLYRIALEADDSVTLSYYESEQLQYKWLLAQADTCSVTIKTAGKTIGKRPDWYPAGSPDPEPYLKAAEVVGEGTLHIVVAGLDTEEFILTEEYHHGDSVEYAEYSLEPAERVGYTMALATRYDGVEEYAIYRVAFEGGEYRFIVTYGS